MEYEIKQVASLMGLSDNGIRFLERRGIARPERDDGSGYRRYRDDDLALLVLYKSFKADGLELADIEEVFRERPDKVAERLEENLGRLRARLARIEESVAITRERLARVSDEPLCDVRPRPHFVFFHSDNDLFRRGGRRGVSPDIERYYLPWNDLAPKTACAIRYAPTAGGGAAGGGQAGGAGGAAGGFQTTRGGIIEFEDLAASGLEPNEYLADYPAEPRCFYVSMSYSNRMSDEWALERLVELLGDRIPGARVSGTVLGRLLNIRMADDELVYSAELWVPYEEGGAPGA